MIFPHHFVCFQSGYSFSEPWKSENSFGETAPKTARYVTASSTVCIADTEYVQGLMFGSRRREGKTFSKTVTLIPPEAQNAHRRRDLENGFSFRIVARVNATKTNFIFESNQMNKRQNEIAEAFPCCPPSESNISYLWVHPANTTSNEVSH